MSENKDQLVAGPVEAQPRKKLAVFRSRKFLLTFVVVVVLIGGFIFALNQSLLGSFGCTIKYTNKCAIKDGANLLTPDKTQEFAKLIPKILKIKNYQSNQDVLYMLVVYYINTSDGTNASKYYNMLEKVHATGYSFKTQFGSKALFMSQLKSSVDFLKQMSSPAHLNFQTGGGATQQ